MQSKLTVRELRGDKVALRDGVIGSLDDVYFDDREWSVRFFGVDTRGGEPGGQLLVPPAAVDAALSGPSKVRLALTRRQLRNQRIGRTRGAGRLRSAGEIIGYKVEARDGPAGRVADLVLDRQLGVVRDLMIDTLRWWPVGSVRLHPGYVEDIDWRSRTVRVRLTRQQVRLGEGARKSLAHL